VALEHQHHVAPALERAIVAFERGQRAVVVAVDVENRLAGFGSLVVVEEFFLVNRGNALPESDPLARRDRDLDLLEQVVDELLVASRAVVDAIDTAQRVEMLRILVEHGLEAPAGLDHVVEPVLVHFADPAQELMPRFTPQRAGSALERLDQAGPVARCLVDPRQRFGRSLVRRILGQYPLVDLARRIESTQALLEDFGRFGPQVAGQRGGRGFGALHQHLTELRPLLGLAVDRGHPLERVVVCRIGREHALKTRQRQIGPLHLAFVPAAHARQDQVLGVRGDVALRSLDTARQHFCQASRRLPASRSISSP
jgi:hypothetical protein